MPVYDYTALNPKGKTFSQICSSIEHNANPNKVKKSIQILVDLGLVFEVKANSNSELQYVLSNRGRYASEIVWDLFRIILNPHESDEFDRDTLDFYR